MRTIFIKARLILVGKVAVFVVGAVLTYNLQLLFIVGAGAVFGIVILVWHARTFRDLANWRCAIFLVASGLSGVAVWWAMALAIGESAISMALLYTGMMLLPLAHKLLLGASWKRTVFTITIICSVFFLNEFVISGLPNWSITIPNPAEFEFSVFNQVTVWQAAYLVSMFGFRQREFEEQPNSRMVRAVLAG